MTKAIKLLLKPMGFEAGFTDEDYQRAGAMVYSNVEIFLRTEIIVKVKELK